MICGLALRCHLMAPSERCNVAPETYSAGCNSPSLLIIRPNLVLRVCSLNLYSNCGAPMKRKVGYVCVGAIVFGAAFAIMMRTHILIRTHNAVSPILCAGAHYPDFDGLAPDGTIVYGPCLSTPPLPPVVPPVLPGNLTGHP